MGVSRGHCRKQFEKAKAISTALATSQTRLWVGKSEEKATEESFQSLLPNDITSTCWRDGPLADWMEEDEAPKSNMQCTKGH